MGEYYQAIVDREASEDEAPALGASIRDWLISERVIEPTPRNCVLGSETGYPPGPEHAKATEVANPYLLETHFNGLEIITRREVYYSLTGDELYLVCDNCRHRFIAPDERGDAIGEWYHRRGAGLLSCPSCGAATPVTRYRHEPPWHFGNLGFMFWNWAPLNPSFIAQVSRRLGHELGQVWGKI